MNPRVFEMEENLAGDSGGEYYRNLQDSIQQDLRELNATINAGLPPAEFQQANKLAEALRRAEQVVEKVWKAEQNLPPV